MGTQLSLIAALVVIVIFMGLSVFQLLLALGKPYGKMAYGGRQEAVLPKKYRIMSALSIGIFLLASGMTLVKIDVFKNCPFPVMADLGVWIFALFLALNTIANATSISKSERKFMTPLSAIACLCLVIIALGL